MYPYKGLDWPDDYFTRKLEQPIPPIVSNDDFLFYSARLHAWEAWDDDELDEQEHSYKNELRERVKEYNG